MTWNHDMSAAPRDRRILVSRPRYYEEFVEIAQWYGSIQEPFWKSREFYEADYYDARDDRASVPTKWMELPT